MRVGNYYVGDPLEWGGLIEQQGINPKNSGTSRETIIFAAYNNEDVSFIGNTNRSFAVDLDSRNYIKIQGLNFTNFYKFLWITNGSHN